LSRLADRQDWDRCFLAYLQTLEQQKPVVCCGDFNVAHTAIDLARPKDNEGHHGFTPEERAGFQNSGVSRNNRMIAGVCAGFALHYGWDINVVRIITALVALFTGIGAVAYLVLWVIIPEAPYALPAKGI